jgi:hypothetical protein
MSEDDEPSLERQFNDAFVEALATGDHSAATDTLRKLQLSGGSLDGVTLKLLADMLVGAAPPHLFPRILIRRRRRGRPAAHKTQNAVTNQKISKSLLDAIASGDAHAIADIFRHKNSLNADELKMLADLLDDNPEGDVCLKYRLQLVRHRAGNSSDLLKTEANIFMRNFLVEKSTALKKEAAIAEVMQKAGRSKATIQNARSAKKRAKLI